MRTGYGWEDLRQVLVTPLGARHVPERLCVVALSILRGAVTNVGTIYLYH